MDTIDDNVQSWVIRELATGQVINTIESTSFKDAKVIFSKYDATMTELLDQDFFTEMIAEVMMNP